LVFYILGWKNYQKKNEDDFKLMGGIGAKIFKFLKKAVIPVVILSIGAGGIFWYLDYQESGGRVDGLHSIRQAELDEFVGRYNRYGKHLENAEQCRTNLIETNLETQKNACQVKYDAAYDKFLNCRNSYSSFSRYDCLNTYGANYEVIDCSEETIKEEIKSKDFSCNSTVNSEYLYLIGFEERLIEDFLEDLPVNKYSLSQEEMSALYSKLPADVFNNKTKERFDTYVEKKGYSIE
jgi:hypothetical protein